MAAPPHPSLLFFAPVHKVDFYSGFASCLLPYFHQFFLSWLMLWFCFPTSSVRKWCRTFHLLSIDYASQPRLRSRLTQSRSALLWKPWIFGQEDSHLFLATHSGILSCDSSTAPCRYSFNGITMLLYQKHTLRHIFPKLRWCVSAPDIFGAGPLD